MLLQDLTPYLRPHIHRGISKRKNVRLDKMDVIVFALRSGYALVR